MHSGRAPEVVLAGAPVDTGNLGVSALGIATVAALLRRGTQVRLLDNSRGNGTTSVRLGQEWECDIQRQGAWYSRRFWRPESLLTMRALSHPGIPILHPLVRPWQRATAMLSLNGGDSFSDIYGEHRFRAVVMPHFIASSIGLPTILLPQTYGPFRDATLRARAIRALESATQCWARDERSFGHLQELLGSSFDPKRHRRGVDVAFALSTAMPTRSDELLSWMEAGDPVIGINVSGLVATTGRGTSGLSGQRYLAALSDFVAWAVRSEFRVLLVPHVIGGSRESDESSCRVLLAGLTEVDKDRVRALWGLEHPGEVKYIISRLDWFTGARMHATIAALSTSTPTVATAYSDKFRGVFADCGQADWIVDLRTTRAADVLEFLKAAVIQRDATRKVLQVEVPPIVELAELQFTEVVAAIGAS